MLSIFFWIVLISYLLLGALLIAALASISHGYQRCLCKKCLSRAYTPIDDDAPWGYYAMAKQEKCVGNGHAANLQAKICLACAVQYQRCYWCGQSLDQTIDGD